MNKYHFTLSIRFKNDYDVKNLQKILKLKLYKVITYSESKGNEKSAKFIYRTDTLTNIYTDDLFAKFIEQIKPKLDKIKEILQTNNGVCVLRIVFDELKEKPCIGLSAQTIALLNDLSADFEVDFN